MTPCFRRGFGSDAIFNLDVGFETFVMANRKKIFNIKEEVWLYPGASPWHFVTMPKSDSEVIAKNFRTSKKGWGSLPVEAKIGKTVWKTSIFPDKKEGAFILPIKSSVRKSERIFRGDFVNLTIKIIV